MSYPWDEQRRVHIIHDAAPGAPLIGCLGGGCQHELRTICRHYQASEARNLSERLCIAGRADEFERVGGAQQRILEES